MIAFWVVRGAQTLGRVLPDRVTERLAATIGTVAYLSLPRKRHHMQHNLRMVLGLAHAQTSPRSERRIRILARRSMQAYVVSVVDFFRLPNLLPRVYRDTALTKGWEHVDRFIEQGQGVVFATAHFGHWDLAGAALAHHCPPGRVFAVAECFADPRLDALITAERASYGLQAVAMTDVRRMVKILRDGNVLGLLVDRPVAGDEGVIVRFFGRETRIPAGAATLAILSKCPILPGFLRQSADGRFHGEILPPIEPQRTGDRAADVQVTMQRVAEALEGVIRRSPHQWYMFRPMWPLPAERAAPSPALSLRRGLGALMATVRRPSV